MPRIQLSHSDLVAAFPQQQHSKMPLSVEIRPIATEETYPLRHTVLWPEKPISFVQLPEDDSGQHFGAFVASSESPVLVGVISLYIASASTTGGPSSAHQQSGASARFRKMCVHPSYQSQGIGSKLVRQAIETASNAGVSSIWCDARASALPFYRRLGLEAEGERFDKSGVEYLVMRRRFF